MRTAVLALAVASVLAIRGTSQPLAAPEAPAPREPLSVGSAVAQPGDVASGWIEVPGGADAGADAAGAAPAGGAPAVADPAAAGAATRIPVSVVHGASPGPILGLVAGTHGYEYTSILALQQVLPRLVPGRMSGSVILVHMANPPTFYGRRIYYGPDGKNLNRVYPGSADGTLSERIAHAITREVIDKSTHLVDMHCGDGNESLRPYTYWTIQGEARVDEASREMALAYGIETIIVDRERSPDPKKSAYTANTAILRGKPALTTESGGVGLTDEPSVATHVAGALSVIAHLEIMDAPSVRVQKPSWIVKSEIVRAPAAGIWRPAVEKEQTVEAGTVLGRITDPFGRLVGEVTAPFAGQILYVVATPPVSEGEPLAYVGLRSDTLPPTGGAGE